MGQLLNIRPPNVDIKILDIPTKLLGNKIIRSLLDRAWEFINEIDRSINYRIYKHILQQTISCADHSPVTLRVELIGIQDNKMAHLIVTFPKKRSLKFIGAFQMHLAFWL